MSWKAMHVQEQQVPFVVEYIALERNDGGESGIRTRNRLLVWVVIALPGV